MADIITALRSYHAFGHCWRCKGFGALWRQEYQTKKWVFFGPLVTRHVFYCDECDGK